VIDRTEVLKKHWDNLNQSGPWQEGKEWSSDGGLPRRGDVRGHLPVAPAREMLW